MTDKRIGSIIAGAGIAASACAAYVFVIRPWHLRWGATDDEIGRSLPGDDLVPHPKMSATHAITIHAPTAAVWPWLVQMGQGRGGMYGYDWIDNLMGLDMHSADRILPEFQSLKVGDIVPLEPGGSGPPVATIEPERVLVLYGKSDASTEGMFAVTDETPGAYFATSWVFFLAKIDERTTRLIERFRLDWNPPSLSNTMFYLVILEPGSFIMERKMLLSIKERAERLGKGYCRES